jgi:hypothetical protein
VLERVAPWLAIALHGALVARVVSLGDLLSGRPIIGGDYGAHYYQAVHAAGHLRSRGALWGYDPWWMAGYPEGLVGLVDGKIFLATLALTPAFMRPAVFDLLIVGMLSCVPVLGYLAARLADASRLEAACVALAGTVVTFTVPLAVFFWAGGAISFFFASAVAVPAAMGALWTIESGRWRSLGGGAALLGVMVCVAIHPAVLPPLAGALLCALVPLWKRPVRCIVGLGAFALASAPALWPPLEAARFAQPSALELATTWWKSDFLQGGSARLWNDWAIHALRPEPGWAGGPGGLAALAVLALIGALLFAVGEDRRRHVSTWLAPWSAIAVCFMLAYRDWDFVSLRFIQPYRFVLPLGFFLCLPAGRGAAYVLYGVARRSPAPVILAAFLG